MKYKSLSGAIVGIVGGGIEIFISLISLSVVMEVVAGGELGVRGIMDIAGSVVCFAGGILALVGGILALKNSTLGGILQILGGVLVFASGFVSSSYYMYGILATNIVSAILSFMVKEPVKARPADEGRAYARNVAQPYNNTAAPSVPSETAGPAAPDRAVEETSRSCEENKND